MSVTRAQLIGNVSGGASFTGIVTATSIVVSAGTTALPSISPTGDSNTGIFFPAADTIAFSEGGAEAARIDSSGRLLVGTSSGSALVHIGNTGDHLFMDRNETTVGGSNAAFRKSRGTTGSPSIVSSGDVLGTLSWRGYDGSAYISSSLIRVEVDGTPGANDMPGRLMFSTTADGAASPTERMRIDNAGRVQIGATSAIFSATLTIQSAANSYNITSSRVGAGTGSLGHVVFETDTGAVGTIFTNGASTSYNTSSDYRLKENIAPAFDGITRLLQLKPSRFNFISEPDRTVDGFIAHEAQAVVPECVTGEKDAVDDDGNPIYQGIDQSKLVPLLTAALQEAVAKIEGLEVRLTAAGIA